MRQTEIVDCIGITSVEDAGKTKAGKVKTVPFNICFLEIA